MTPYTRRIEIEDAMRLFSQLHQSDLDDWYRSSGRMLCTLCGCTYSRHPVEEMYHIDHRLCNGVTVHL